MSGLLSPVPSLDADVFELLAEFGSQYRHVEEFPGCRLSVAGSDFVLIETTRSFGNRAPSWSCAHGLLEDCK